MTITTGRYIAKCMAAAFFALAATQFAAGAANAQNIESIRKSLPKFGVGSDSQGAPRKGTVKVNTSLNVRTGAWGDVVGSLYNGDQVNIIGQEGEWYVIDQGGERRYVHSNYVTAEGGAPQASGESFAGTVRAGGGLNVRTAPWGPIIGLLADGSSVTVTGCSGEWYTIDYNGQKAFIHSNYVDRGGSTTAQTPGPAPQQPATPPAAVNGFVFPVQEFCSFSDRSYSCHARGGSPFNLGVDIFGKIGLQLYAVRDGRIGGNFGWDNTGGNRLHVIDGSGNDYYYAHLSEFSNARPGMNVPAGTVVGYLGKTGNAINTDAHLHFSMVDANDQSVDPTQLLRNSKK